MPVLVIDYEWVAYSNDMQIPLAVDAIWNWSYWYPDHFLILL